MTRRKKGSEYHLVQYMQHEASCACEDVAPGRPIVARRGQRSIENIEHTSHVTSLSRYNNRPQARDGTCSKMYIGHPSSIYGVLQHGIPTGERRSVEVLNG